MHNDWIGSHGYVYLTPDGSLNYVTLDPVIVAQQQLTTNATPPVRGHEACGPQATDAKATSESMCEVLQGWATAACNEARGRTMDDAISALHRQHTRDGRPSRFIPEVE